MKYLLTEFAHDLGFPMNNFPPGDTLRSYKLQAFQVIVFDCNRKMKSVIREKKSTK